MKVLLEFTGEGSDLRLYHGQVRNDRLSGEVNQADIWDGMAAGAGPNVIQFQWRPAVRGFCALVLEGLIRRKPYHAILRGPRRSLASSLAEILGDKSSKSGNNTWIQHLFSPYIKQEGSDRRVPHNVLLPTTNSDKQSYSVSLGNEWRDAAIHITFDKEDADLPTALRLLSALNRQQENNANPEPVPCLSVAVDLLVWDPERGLLRAGETSRFPLPVGLGVALRVQLSRPAYPYVIWLNSRRQLQPLFPWRGFQWSAVAAASPVTALTLPDISFGPKLDFYPIDSSPGVEIALVLATEILPSRSALRLLEKSFPRHPVELPDPTRIYRVTDRRQLSEGPRKFRLGKPLSWDDPLGGLCDATLGLVGRDFPAVAGLAFCTK